MGDPALVLLHSFGAARGEWRDCIESLSAHRRCIALDLPGFGEAAKIGGYTVAEMSDAVNETLQRLGVANYLLVGHSMSGKVAMSLAARRPNGLVGLVLVSPSPPSPEPIADDARRTMLEMARTSAFADAFLDRITAVPLSGVTRRRAVADFVACAPAAWVAWLECGSKEDCSAGIGTLDVPALVVTGALDPALPAGVQRKLTLPHLACARLVEIPKCGHLPMLETAATLSRLIGNFVRQRVDSHTESST